MKASPPVSAAMRTTRTNNRRESDSFSLKMSPPTAPDHFVVGEASRGPSGACGQSPAPPPPREWSPGLLTFFPTSSLELIRSSMSARSCLFCLSDSSLASSASSRARARDRALVSFSLASASARSRSSA